MKVNICELGWFDAVVWNEAVGLVELWDIDFWEKWGGKNAKKNLYKRFIELRGYIPWQRPEKWPDLGNKLERAYWDLSEKRADMILKGDVILV